jgi:XRE family transcriptional regulator
MSTKFDDFLNEQLNDVEIRSEYEALQPEHALIQAIIDARQELSDVIPENQNFSIK